MSISYFPGRAGESDLIKISGQFDFNVRQEFRDAYEQIESGGRSCVVDFRETDYVDSSALGMLLLFRDYLGASNSNIKLINCGETISKIFKISNFHQLFTIAEVSGIDDAIP